MSRRADGVGLGLRWRFLDQAAAGLPGSIGALEVTPENYLTNDRRTDKLERLRRDHAFLSHGLSLDIGGTGPLDLDYLKAIRAFLDRFELPLHTDHLCWTRHDGRALHELLPLRFDLAEVKRIADRIHRAREVLGGRDLALENISTYADVPGDLDEAEFMGELLDRTDCGLLLDLNNLYTNATNRGLDPLPLLRRYPLHRVCYLHVAGGQRLAECHDLLIDTHAADTPDPVLGLLHHTLAHTGPRPVIYERDHGIPELSEILAHLEQLHRHYAAALAGGPLAPPPAAPRERSAPIDLETPFDRDAFLAQLASPVAPETPALQTYHHLVRAGLLAPLHALLPRTTGALADTAQPIDTWLDRWLIQDGPRSPILRELPREFVRWCTPRWKEELAPFIPELAHYEVLLQHARNAPSAGPPPRDPGLDDRLSLHPSARVAHFDHAVHTATPQRRLDPATALLVHRGPSGEPSTTILTPYACDIVERLVPHATLRELAGPDPTPAGLTRLARLLADLAQEEALAGVS